MALKSGSRGVSWHCYSSCLRYDYFDERDDIHIYNERGKKGKKKVLNPPTRNRTLNLGTSRPDALLLSYGALLLHGATGHSYFHLRKTSYMLLGSVRTRGSMEIICCARLTRSQLQPERAWNLFVRKKGVMLCNLKISSLKKNFETLEIVQTAQLKRS